jgi:hypothetical protein
MTKQICKVNKRVLETNVQSKVEWAELRFPPLNLYNIWPTAAMAAIHAETQDAALWEEY